ncbi:sigma-70 family RNA polymerase sigma factor [Sphingobacterium sp. GVS05A]|uniref:sigma-70 family RNA polymerase sigma factor n=1 Tax=Sphingobacterium sp. GVS05A TaxID=2862679 RepID=UPI001CBEB464|nr:sigma-70 family RNA polymerase sigma factor [Sphingobacterium sp. GVS05A]
MMSTKIIDRHINMWIDGNDTAFKYIFDYYYPRLLSASLKPIKNHQDAEELVMNVLLKIWQNKYRINHLNTHLTDYLFGILRQEMAGLARKKVILTTDYNDIPLQLLGSNDHPELSMKDLQTSYQAALRKLSAKQREVFLMSRNQLLTQKEIAEQTGLSIHTVNNHITSALKIIRRELYEYPHVVVLMYITTQSAVSILN